MKTKQMLSIATLTLMVSCLYGLPVKANGFGGQGNVTVTDSGISEPVDPEKPGDVVDPGPGPSTDGNLRIDFASTLDFGSAKITDTDRIYPSLAQLFRSETNARGYYVQVTDRRPDATGWTLTLTQDKQFNSSIIQDLDNQELTGAVLSFGNGWANSSGGSGMPSVSRDTLAINEMNTSYTVATATQGQGTGVWTIAFGASAENDSNQENTLTALTDAAGNPLMDATYNKQAYSNSAVSLTVPDTTKIYPVQYTTTLTWRLEAGPTE